MKQPNHFRKCPIQNRDDDRHILKVGINAVGKMRGIALITDVVDNPERSRNMEPDGFRNGRGRELGESFDQSV